MKVPKSDIEALEKWLEPRLGALVSHSEKVRELLRSANAPEAIVELATELVTAENPAEVEVSPQQLAVWKALLPIVAEHGLLAVRGGGPSLEPDKPLNKEEAAEYLGFSVSKLNRHIKKKQIQYKKYGTGKTATVRFLRAELDRFSQSRNVAAKKCQ
jgi:excisionase family DNA binding protein